MKNTDNKIVITSTPKKETILTLGNYMARVYFMPKIDTYRVKVSHTDKGSLYLLGHNPTKKGAIELAELSLKKAVVTPPSLPTTERVSKPVANNSKEPLLYTLDDIEETARGIAKLDPSDSVSIMTADISIGAMTASRIRQKFMFMSGFSTFRPIKGQVTGDTLDPKFACFCEKYKKVAEKLSDKTIRHYHALNVMTIISVIEKLRNNEDIDFVALYKTEHKDDFAHEV